MSIAASPITPQERRLLHDIAGDGRERHYMRKRSAFRPGDLAHYECECGAQADRFGNLLPDESSPWPLR